MGRMPILSDTIKAEAMVALVNYCNGGRGFALPGTFWSFIEPWVRKSMGVWGIPNSDKAKIPFGPLAIARLYREMCSGKIRKGDQQDLARYARQVNLVGHISSAAVTASVMFDENGKQKIKTSMVFNQDAMTMLVADEMTKKSNVRIPKETQDTNRKRSQSGKTLSSSAATGLSKIKTKVKKELTKSVMLITLTIILTLILTLNLTLTLTITQY